MIITIQKPFEEILEATDGLGPLFLVGCGDCATLCRTGGENELLEMSEKLSAEGIEITGTAVVQATCHELDAQRVLRKHREELKKAKGILVLACGAGVQAIGDSNEKPTLSGCDSLFIGNSRRQMYFYEKCSACGNCVLNLTCGLCPVTRCPKSLINGPCGGAVKGKCEVNHENNCVWIEIYERLKSRGAVDNLLRIVEPRDYSDSFKPRKLEAALKPGR